MTGISRRRWIGCALGIGIELSLLRALERRAHAGPAKPADEASSIYDRFPEKTARRLRNRVELWRGSRAHV